MEDAHVSGKGSNAVKPKIAPLPTTFNKKSLVNHLAESPNNDDVILDVPRCGNMTEEESMKKQKVDDIYEIEIDGYLYRRKPSQPKIEVEAKSWEIVLENIRRLERENEDLKKEVKSQEEKCVHETAEKVYLMSQLKQKRKEIVKLNQMAPESTERKSILKQISESERTNLNTLNQNHEVGGSCLFTCFSGFHGFFEEETVMSISSGRKMLLDKIIAGEETSIEALDDQLDELWKKNVLGKIIHEDELDTSREWSEEARSLLEDN